MVKLIIFYCCVVLLGWGCRPEYKNEKITYIQYVDPFIGTAYTGHTYPGATTPFGMVQLGPDNGVEGWEYCSGYHDKTLSIIGFSHTHLSGTGCPDMGDIMLMPVSGDVAFSHDSINGKKGYRSVFSHETEKASPGFYGVTLEDYNIQVELTSTARSGFHKYRYQELEQAGVMIDLEHGIGDSVSQSFIKLLDDQTIVGMRRSTGFIKDHRYYFFARFSKPFCKVITYRDGIVSQEKSIEGIRTKALVQFDMEEGEELKVKVGLSTTSETNAGENVDMEIPGWNFDEIRNRAETGWNELLKRVEIDPLTEGQKVSFYTSLYHSLIMPNLVTDVDGSYRGWDTQVHTDDCNHYTNFSLWDTYRAQHPFLALLYPEYNICFVNSLLERYKQTGLLVTNEYGMCETWAMIGNHAIPVIVDAYMKGQDIDLPLAYDAIKTSSTKTHYNSDWPLLDQYGYFPYDKVKAESVSKTLEMAYDDYCVAVMAKALGKTKDYEFFKQRSQSYQNLFDPSIKLMRGKDSKGEWRKPFNPFELSHASTIGGDFTEGNSWQYTWHIQHDVEALIKLMGGRRTFVAKLDSLFTQDSIVHSSGFTGDVTGLIGQYAHGNEPSHHILYLYTLAGQSDKAAPIIRRIFDEFYLPKRDGLCGNDDCGQMSAWYIFSGMGFYPVDPISGHYVFGAPQFHSASLLLPNGKKLDIKAKGISAENKCVKSIQFNGQGLATRSISYQDLMKGGELVYEMYKGT